MSRPPPPTRDTPADDGIAAIARKQRPDRRIACETIVKDGVAAPIDYANASPDVALTSLHYYFPWAIRALVRWTAFCSATGRQMRINQTTRDYFEVGDRGDLTYEQKQAEYRRLADAYIQVPE